MLASSGNELKLWDLSAQDHIALVKEYRPESSGSARLAPVSWFSVRSDYGQIASVVKGDSISLTNTATHEQEYLRESSDDVTCCCYDSTGRYLAAATNGGSLDIFDFNSSSAKRRNWRVNAPVSCISWSKTDRYIALGSTNGTVTLFNKVMHVLSNPAIGVRQNGTTSAHPAVTSIQYSPNNSSLIGCTYDDGAVLLWDMSKEKLQSTYKSHNLPCTSFSFSPINNILMVSGGLDGLCCYDVHQKKTIKTIPCPGGVSSLDMHPNGTHVCVGTASGHLKIFDLRNLHTDPLFSQLIHDTSVHCIKFLQTTGIKVNEVKSENITLTRPTTLHHGSQQQMNHTPENHSRLVNNNVIKKSSSFDHQAQLAAMSSHSHNLAGGGGGPSFNIFSPEVGSSHPYQSSMVSLNSAAAPFHSTGVSHLSETTNIRNNEESSFILHKKQAAGNLTNGHLGSNGVKPELGTPILTNEGKQVRVNKLRNDMFSPLNNNQSPTNNTTMVPGELPSTSLIAQFAQAKKLNEGKRVSPSSSFSNASSLNLKNPVSPKSSLSGMSQQGGQSNPMNTQSTSSTSSQPAGDQTSPNLPPSSNGGLLNGHHSTSSTHLAACASINQTSMMPMRQLEEAIKDKIDDFRDELMSENFRFKAEMLKEFMDLKTQIQKSLEACSLNEELLKEIVKLREENKRLKKLF